MDGEVRVCEGVREAYILKFWGVSNGGVTAKKNVSRDIKSLQELSREDGDTERRSNRVRHYLVLESVESSVLCRDAGGCQNTFGCLVCVCVCGGGG